MGAVTVTTSAKLSLGNRDGVVALLGNVDDGDTWNTGLAAIEHVSITDTVSGRTYGYTASGGTITFAVDSSHLTTPTVLVIGFK